MKLAASILLAAAASGLLPLPASAQLTQELIEEVRRLAGDVADLREANAAQARRISQMQREIDALRDAVRDSHERSTSKMGDFTTREDLRRIVDQIKDVDQKREADRRLILGEFEKLGRTLAQPAPSAARRPPPREKEPEKDAAPVEGTFLTHKVKDGQSLSEILKEYNAALKQQGLPSVTLDQVRRANPKLNVNRIVVGQEILLPVPEKKKQP